MSVDGLKRGIYRTRDEILGDAARVTWLAGDGAPYLSRDLYETLGFAPTFEALPTREEYVARHPRKRGSGRPFLTA